MHMMVEYRMCGTKKFDKELMCRNQNVEAALDTSEQHRESVYLHKFAAMKLVP